MLPSASASTNNLRPPLGTSNAVFGSMFRLSHVGPKRPGPFHAGAPEEEYHTLTSVLLHGYSSISIPERCRTPEAMGRASFRHWKREKFLMKNRFHGMGLRVLNCNGRRLVDGRLRIRPANGSRWGTSWAVASIDWLLLRAQPHSDRRNHCGIVSPELLIR